MAIVNIVGGLTIPPIPSANASPSGTLTNILFLSNATDQVAFVFRVPRTGTLDKFEYLTGSVSGSQNAKLSFQTVDPATGLPDTVVDQYRVLAVTASAWQTPGLMTSDGTDGGAKRSVTRGEWLACVVGFDTFPGGTGFNVKGQVLALTTNNLAGSAYLAYNSGGTWAKNSTAGVPVLALKYDDGVYEHIQPNVYPMSDGTATSFASNSTPDERGLIFQVPYACEVDACWVRLTASANCDIVLYDSASSVLQTIAVDSDMRPTAAADDVGCWYRFPTVQALSASTTYRLVVKPTTTTAVVIQVATVAVAGHLNAWEGGTGWHYTTRTDAGSWTDTTTQRPYMGLNLSGIDVASGSGGEVSHVFA
jgi:hypothetical protein